MNLVLERGKTGFHTCLRRGGPAPPTVRVSDTQTKGYIHASFNREEMAMRAFCLAAHQHRHHGQDATNLNV
jgi:hypothetical protein